MPSPFISDFEPKVVSASGAYASKFELLTRDQVSDREQALSHTTFHTLGAIYRSDGNIISMSARSGGHSGDHVTALDLPFLAFKEEQRKQWPRVSGNTLYLGNFMNHYGHFITESLARMWYLFEHLETADFDNYAYYPFIFDEGNIIISPFHDYFLDMFRIPREKIIPLSDPVVFENIVVPQQLWVVNKFCYERLRPLFAAVRKDHERETVSSKIFLTRSTAKPDRFVNIKAVEDLFASFGFEILTPEQIEIRHQLDTYANCGIMAGFSGSALHNCLFSRPNTFLIELCDKRCPNTPLPMQSICNDLAQVTATHIPYRESRAGGVNMRALKKQLKAILSAVGE